MDSQHHCTCQGATGPNTAQRPEHYDFWKSFECFINVFFWSFFDYNFVSKMLKPENTVDNNWSKIILLLQYLTRSRKTDIFISARCRGWNQHRCFDYCILPFETRQNTLKMACIRMVFVFLHILHAIIGQWCTETRKHTGLASKYSTVYLMQ